MVIWVTDQYLLPALRKIRLCCSKPTCILNSSQACFVRMLLSAVVWGAGRRRGNSRASRNFWLQFCMLLYWVLNLMFSNNTICVAHFHFWWFHALKNTSTIPKTRLVTIHPSLIPSLFPNEKLPKKSFQPLKNIIIHYLAESHPNGKSIHNIVRTIWHIDYSIMMEYWQLFYWLLFQYCSSFLVS